MVLIEDSGFNRNENIMKISSRPVFCREDEKVIDLFKKMFVGYRRIPVVDKDNFVVGIVTLSDVLKSFLFNQDVYRTKVEDIMLREPIVIEETETLDFLLRLFKFSKRGGFPVVDKKGRVKAIVSERDFVRLFENVSFNVKVKDVMTKKPLVVKNNFTLEDCAKSFVMSGFRRFPILDENNNLVGIITLFDLIKYIALNDFKKEVLSRNLMDIAVKDVIKINEESDVSDFIKLTKDKFIGGLLVVDNSNKLTGIITERDVIELIE
ncbi:MAG: CBS domain-containing protein [Candidatus Aenigmarchaeota archaeon]|nr:CBS domain-containing protein [Candidatus Aenigmarchaeota archaeon]MDW8149068.1 CBS domain-containing protein [Candidatus Aenigmarchaeota archaeon]